MSSYSTNNVTLHVLTLILVPLSGLAIKGSSSTPRGLDTVNIYCNVTANPPANIVWVKRTNERIQTLFNTPRTSITHQLTNTPSGPASRSTLTIRNVEATDNGDYICEASNDHSSPPVSTKFTICVIGKAKKLGLLFRCYSLILSHVITLHSCRICHHNATRSCNKSS